MRLRSGVVGGHGCGKGGRPLGHQRIGPGHGLGHGRIIGQGRHLILPKIEITAGKLIDVRRICHKGTILQE